MSNKIQATILGNSRNAEHRRRTQSVCRPLQKLFTGKLQSLSLAHTPLSACTKTVSDTELLEKLPVCLCFAREAKSTVGKPLRE